MGIFGKHSYLTYQRRILLLAQDPGFHCLENYVWLLHLVLPSCPWLHPLTASPGSPLMTRPLCTTPVIGQLSLGYPPTLCGLSCLDVPAFSSLWNSLLFLHIHFLDLIQILTLPKYALLSPRSQAELIYMHTHVHVLSQAHITLGLHLNLLFIVHWLLLGRLLYLSSH